MIIGGCSCTVLRDIGYILTYIGKKLYNKFIITNIC